MTTTRLGLPTPGDADAPDPDQITDGNNILDDALMYDSGAFASRPPTPVEGFVYRQTDAGGNLPADSVTIYTAGVWRTFVGEGVQLFTASGSIAANGGKLVVANSASNITLTLPTAISGMQFEIYNVGTGRVSAARTSPDTIDGLTTSFITLAGGKTKFTANGAGTWVSMPLTGTDVQVFTANGTYTKPGGAKLIEVLAIGGGAAGDSWAISAPVPANGANPGKSGGGAGQVVQRKFLPADLGSTAAVVVGAGGSTTGGSRTFTWSAGVVTWTGPSSSRSSAGSSSFGGSSVMLAQSGSGSGGGAGGVSTNGVGGDGGRTGSDATTWAGSGGGGGGTNAATGGAGGTGGLGGENQAAGVASTIHGGGSGGVGGQWGGAAPTAGGSYGAGGGGGAGPLASGPAIVSTGGNGAPGIVIVTTHF